jgi:tetratricopeptide (TPR) repeat protein
MRRPRDLRRRLVIAPPVGFLAVALIAGVLAGGARWTALRPGAGPPPSSRPAAARQPAAAAQTPVDAAAARPATPASPAPRPPEPISTRPDVAAPTAAAALLVDAAAARQQGDLRTTLALLQAAVARAPTVETHAALGALYLELGVSRAAETQLRAAVEGDPGNADRWIALANALALQPDPIAAADALAQARAAEPGLRVTRGASGLLAREPPLPAP